MAQLVTLSHPDVAGEAVVALAAVPGHAARGWLVTGAVTGGTASSVPTLTRPAANASADAWRTYAVAAHVLGAADGLGFDAAMAATRDELVAHFAALPELPEQTDVPTDTQES